MAPPIVKRGSKPRNSSEQPLASSFTKSFFNLEDEFSSHVDRNKIESDLSLLVGNIRNSLKNNTAGLKKTEIRDSLLLNAARLRRLNRHSNFRNRVEYSNLNDVRQKVEAHHLSLQNVTNEIAHLRKNIEACLEFQPSDADIELVEPEEYVAKAPPGEHLDPAVSDPHQYYLCRLNHELKERNCMLANLQELEGRKSALLSDIRGKEQRLAQIRPKIGSVKRSTGPLLELLSVKLRQQNEKIKENQRALQLGPIYANEEVCREIFGSCSIQLGSDAQITLDVQQMEVDESFPSNIEENGPKEMPLPIASLKNFIKMEEETATSMGALQLRNRASAIISDLRSAISEGSSNSANHFFERSIVLHQLNRLLNIHKHVQRNNLAEIRTKMEERSIELETLASNMNYLRHSVELCLDYEPPLDADIELIPTEQFYMEMQISIARPILNQMDSHQLHLARMKHELATRKGLLEKLLELEREKKALLTTISSTERTMGKVGPRLESLKKIAKPLLDIVGLKSVALSAHNREIPFRPVPVEPETYEEIFGEKSVDKRKKGGQQTEDDDEMEEWEEQLATELEAEEI